MYTFQQVEEAIEREKNIKKWKRDWKIQLIERNNKKWLDLSRDWFDNILKEQHRLATLNLKVCLFAQEIEDSTQSMTKI